MHSPCCSSGVTSFHEEERCKVALILLGGLTISPEVDFPL